MAKILNFHHPGLVVAKDQYHQILKFYTDKMGYSLYCQGKEGECNYAILKLNDTWFEIMDLGETLPELRQGERAVIEHIAFTVDDINEFMKEATELGCEVIFEPIQIVFAEEKEVQTSFLRNTFGEVFEVMQFM